MKYKGGCHCGKIAYEVESELQGVVECNCSICSKKGYLHWFVPRSALKLLTPESNLATYLFNKKHIKHRFCPTCGVGTFGEAIDPKSGQPMAAVNVRCLEGIDLKTLKINAFDGRSL